MSEKRFYVGIRNEASTNTLELHFLDYIYDGFDWSTYEYVNMVQDTISKIKAANPSTIKIYINSLGGDVMIGLALYNYLKSYNATKEVHIIGFAASIASVIAMCASEGKLHMAKNSFMIIHAAWSYASGNASDMRQQAENLDKVSNELADIYAQRSGKEATYFTNLWAAGDYWMTGTEAKELGLADELTEAEAVNASVDIKGYGFKNVPQALLNAAVQPSDNKNILQTINEGFMNIKNTLLNAIAGKKEDKTTDAIQNKADVLALVESVLTPFAEAVDTALEGIKPAAETTAVEETTTTAAPAETTTTATAAPAAAPETTTAAPATEGVEEEEEPATVEAQIAQLQNQLDALKNKQANAAMKPASAKGGGAGAKDPMAGVKVEFEK